MNTFPTGSKTIYKYSLNPKFGLVAIFILSWLACFGQDIQFSHQRGFYENSFNLSINSSIQNASIRYTTDGSEPTVQNGSAYSGNINISTTTIVRAFAYNNVDTTISVSHSYLFLQDIINQADEIAGYPDQLELDPDVIFDPLYANMMEAALKKIPSLSIAISLEDFNDPDIGIHANPQERGSDWERKSSFELIYPDGSSGFFVEGGLRIHGGASRNRRKKTFRVLFKGEYGYGKLDYDLFGPGSNKSIDGLVLRSRGGNSYVHSNGTHRERSQYLRDHIANELFRDMGHVSSHGIKVHLYINGIYWGLYNTVEYLHDNFHAAYFGGDEEDYDVFNHSGLENGDSTAWMHAINLANAGLSTETAWSTFKKEVDVSNLFDYIILNHYGGNTDWDHNNWYSAKRRDTSGRWRFFPWDSEQFFKEETIDVTTKNNPLKPTNLFNKALENDEALIYFQDKVHCFCFDEGILTPSKVDSIWMHEFSKFDIAMIGESARWGDDQTPTDPYTYFNEAITEQNRLRNIYFPTRTNILLDQYRALGWFTNFDGVVFSKNGGTVNSGFQLNLNNPNASGNIYYTTDGTDPRLPGGAISSSAILYNSSIAITSGQTIKARVKSGTTWSAMCPKDFYIAQDFSNIVINEIHYHPIDSILPNDTIGGRNFEFIEIHNDGNFPVDLSGMRFSDGVDYAFPMGSTIQANQYIVIAEDDFWFLQRYGFEAFGRYANKLDNGGERLAISSPQDQIIDEVIYDDVAPWTPDADGLGYSLALIEGQDNSLPSSWNIQSVLVTPAAKNLFCTPISVNPFLFDVSCFNGEDGFIQVSANGGTQPYQFNWSNGISGSSISNLSAGIYDLTVVDANTCEEVFSFTITEPNSELSINFDHENQTNYNSSDGSATAIVTGGTSPYTFAWSTGALSDNIQNLVPGTYTVTVTDDNNCSTSNFIVILPVTCNINASINKTDVDYFGADNGTATAVASGGPSPYSYLWSTGENTPVISNLSPAVYTVTITASNDCFDTATTTISEVDCSNTSVSINHTDLTYLNANDGTATAIGTGQAPFSYVWSNGATSQSVDNLNPGTYLVTLTDAKGCVSDGQVVILNINCASFNLSVSTTDISYLNVNDGTATANPSGIAPFSYDWSNGSSGQSISNLSPGNYSLTVTDAAGCFATNDFTILDIECSSLNINTSSTDLSSYQLNDGTATASGTGGTPPYTYNWSNGSSTNYIDNLAPGTYTLTITDNTGCSITGTETIQEVDCNALNVNVTETHVSTYGNNDGMANATGTGGNTPYTYHWSNGETGTSITNLTAGNYQITIVDDLACTQVHDFTIQEGNTGTIRGIIYLDKTKTTKKKKTTNKIQHVASESNSLVWRFHSIPGIS